MPRYEVVEPCYVPVANGVKFKQPGQVVTLDETDAADLDGYVRPVHEPGITGITVTLPTAEITGALPGELNSSKSHKEVNSGAGKSSSAVQRAVVEDRK